MVSIVRSTGVQETSISWSAFIQLNCIRYTFTPWLTSINLVIRIERQFSILQETWRLGRSNLNRNRRCEMAVNVSDSGDIKIV